MKILILSLCCLLSFTCFSNEVNLTKSDENIIKIYATLIPNAGSFVATSDKARGRLIKNQNNLSADRISVFANSFTTENTLRDKHLEEYLSGGATLPHPRIDIINLKGQDNQAQATIVINGINKDINFNYKSHANFATAEFYLDTNDFKLPKAEFLGVKVDTKVKIEVKYFWESK